MDQGGLLRKPIAYVIFIVTGIAFVFFQITEKDLAERGNILWTGGYTFRTLSVSLLAGGALGALICAAFYKAARKKRLAAKPSLSEEKHLLSDKKRFPLSAVSAGSFLLLILAWLPAYLAYYPAICSYDSPIQMGQIAEHSYIDHHPLAHTLLMEGAVTFGEKVFQSANAGMGLYALLQLMLLAFSFAFGIARLYRHGCGKVLLAMLQAGLMCYPFHAYLSITVTKDIIFSAFFILQMLAAYELLYQEPAGKRVTWRELLFFTSTVGMILFRNNGKYAFLVFLIFTFFCALFGKEQKVKWRKLFLFSLAGLLAGLLSLTALFHLTRAGQGDKREMLSMPIQQLARCMIYHGGVGVLAEDDDTMDETDKALIRDFILGEGYREYDPAISDPVKRHVNTYVVRYRPKEFAQTYFHLLTRYAGDFINAALAVDAGYLYPEDVSHAFVNAGQEAGMGYVQTRWNEEVFANYGIYKDSKWEWLHEHMERWADDNAYLRIPVLRYLFMPGIWVWLYLLLFGWLFLNNRFELCLPLTLILGYYGTLLLGPTVQLRYIYPMMAAFPFAALMGTLKKRRENV